MLTWTEIDTRAIAFQKRWKGCSGDEKQDSQTFEKDFMEIFGFDWHDGFHEHTVLSTSGFTNYIDYYLPGKILIEMKSRVKLLNHEIQKKELLSFEGKVSTNGSFSYSAPAGLHDDCVMSLAIAWDACSKMNGSAALLIPAPDPIVEIEKEGS